MSIDKNGKQRRINPKIFSDDEDVDSSKEEDLGEFREKVKDLIFNCNGMICDEVQHWASETCQIISECASNARYRIGASATPFRDQDDDILIEACFGRELCNINASFLIDSDFLVQPTIYFVSVNNMPNRKFLDYHEAYEEFIVRNELRNQWIADIAKNFADNGRQVLILIKNIEHGEKIQSLIPGSVFLHGQKSSKDRKERIEEMRSQKAKITIASTIFDEGIDVRPLDALILGGGGKSRTRALQRIGRILRKFQENGVKKTSAVVVDFDDQTKWLKKHSKERRSIYKTEPSFIIKDLEKK